MAPAIATPCKRGRPPKQAAANRAATPKSIALPKTPKSSLKRKRPSRTPGCISTAFISTIELLNDLDRFCGVGSLDILMPRRAAPGCEAPDGWLWLETPAYRYKYDKSTIEANLIELVERGVVRCTYCMLNGGNMARVRVYVLPHDFGRSLVQRDVGDESSKRLKFVLPKLDVSVGGWNGQVWRVGEAMPELALKDRDVTALFYIFNTLESPKPDPRSVWIKDENTKELLQDVLSQKRIPGLKTDLYNYQKRSVALMLQKELAPERTLDPRLREVSAPTGQVYFLDFETMELLEEPRYYEDVKGGILAEEMGMGKTLICLSVILASKYQISYIPEEHEPAPLRRSSVASLSDICVAAIWRNAVPWSQFTDSGLPPNCVKKIKDGHGFYEVPPPLRSRSSRYTYDSNAMERIYLGTGTIIVCPSNLVNQWRGEIEKHVEKDALKVLTLDHSTAQIPSVLELLKYDVIIFSRPRFDAEAREGRDSRGRTEFYGVAPSCRCAYKGSTRVPDCVCFKKEAVYRSPLMSIQWKRLIVDEGHSMASSKTNSVCVAEKLPVERRWIVTGTPTRELFGVSAGMKTGESEEESRQRKEKELEERKERQAGEATDLERIGRMVCDFLGQKPWAPMDDRRNTEKASWKKYIDKGFRNQHTGSTACVRSIFQRLFVRHSRKDLEKDRPLPPLVVEVVKLQPRFFERVSMNLLLGALATNAVTSERTGKDYMFHTANRGALKILTNNLLTRSGFYFNGYSVGDVKGSIKTARRYLAENETQCGKGDIMLLLKAIKAGEMALGSKTWRDISVYHDMVYFLSDFPEQLAPTWSFSTSIDPLGGTDVIGLFEIGGSQVQNLQKSVNAHASEYDITYKLESLGKAFNVARQREILAGASRKRNGEPLMGAGDKRNPPAASATPGPKAKGKKTEKTPAKSKTPLKSALKESKPVAILPPDSQLAKARIIGTASTKLTYLMNKIATHHKTEKILVFYEADEVASYIAQALEILGIENLGYSKDLHKDRRASNLDLFQYSEKYRVLLMDLNQAARGLNVSCATRVFFVNPVWQRDVETQAVKRAHRIGQTKPVYVETLILADTIEDEMWERREAMTHKEQQDAKDSLKDSKMCDIIANLKFLEVEQEDQKACMLATPEPIFGDGKHGGVYDEIEDINIYRAASIVASHIAPDEQVMSDLPTLNTSDLPSTSGPPSASDPPSVSDPPSARVRWVDATPQASPAPSRKRRLSNASSMMSSEDSAGSSSRSARWKKRGFKAGDDRDWMEDSDDDFGESTSRKGKSVHFG